MAGTARRAPNVGPTPAGNVRDTRQATAAAKTTLLGASRNWLALIPRRFRSRDRF